MRVRACMHKALHFDTNYEDKRLCMSVFLRLAQGVTGANASGGRTTEADDEGKNAFG